MPASLHACQPANLPTCKPANLPTCQPTHLPACLPTHITVVNSAHRQTFRSTQRMTPPPYPHPIHSPVPAPRPHPLSSLPGCLYQYPGTFFSPYPPSQGLPPRSMGSRLLHRFLWPVKFWSGATEEFKLEAVVYTNVVFSSNRCTIPSQAGNVTVTS